MCISKFKTATKKVAKFIRDNTSIDYGVARSCIKLAFKLYKDLDVKEKCDLIKYTKNTMKEINLQFSFNSLEEDYNVKK